MTDREKRLRERIDVLSDQRERLRVELGALVASTRKQKFRRCAYCGNRCYGYACALHRDLVQGEYSA